MQKLLILILFFACMYACTSKHSNPDLAMKGLSDSAAATEPNKVSVPFDNDADFDIRDLTYRITPYSSSGDTTQCSGWRVEAKDVKRMIKDAEVISGSEWHHLFDVLRCEAHGTIVQEGRTYSFEMNAGSWFAVISTDTTVRLGSFKKEYERYFLSTASTGE